MYKYKRSVVGRKEQLGLCQAGRVATPGSYVLVAGTLLRPPFLPWTPHKSNSLADAPKTTAPRASVIIYVGLHISEPLSPHPLRFLFSLPFSVSSGALISRGDSSSLQAANHRLAPAPSFPFPPEVPRGGSDKCRGCTGLTTVYFLLPLDFRPFFAALRQLGKRKEKKTEEVERGHDEKSKAPQSYTGN